MCAIVSLTHSHSEKSNLTQLLNAFDSGLGNALDPDPSSSLSSRLLAVRYSLKAYDDLSAAVRDEFNLDDLNRYVTYASLAANIELSTWTDLAVAQYSLLTASYTLATSIEAQVSAALGLQSGIIATIITLSSTSASDNSTSATRQLLDEMVSDLANRPSTSIMRDGRVILWLRLLQSALNLTARATRSLRYLKLG